MWSASHCAQAAGISPECSSIGVNQPKGLQYQPAAPICGASLRHRILNQPCPIIVQICRRAGH